MKHIVLAGGGHANALALLELKGRGNITLISDGSHTPYSGMLPGYIAGHYRREQCFINLQQTAAACGADFIEARIIGVTGSSVLLADGRQLAFDVLSLNTGASPPPPACTNACAIKPIEPFISWLVKQDSSEELSQVAVIGGGAGGVETVLALAQRWRHKTPRPQLVLVASRLLRTGTAAQHRHIKKQLDKNNIQLHIARATAYDGNTLQLADGTTLPCTRAVYTTAVAASSWFADTGLPLDDDGFIRVNPYLQALGRENIFISGDAAAHSPALPKAGVIAVRQAKVLAHNLAVTAGRQQGKLKRFNNSRQALYILGDGDGEGAVASRNGITISGKWTWRWKQHLDHKFMNKFPGPPSPSSADGKTGAQVG